MNKNHMPIKYTSRSFDSIKEDLVNLAKRYYPESFRDFSEAGFGSMVFDSIAYVGDILSFYLDYNVNESFIDSAIEYGNVMRLAKQMGYKPSLYRSSIGVVSLYAIVPATVVSAADGSAAGPDQNYIPILQKGTVFSTSGGKTFTLLSDVNFADRTNDVVVAEVGNSTLGANTLYGRPTYYAIKAYGQVISGKSKLYTATIGNFEKFLKVYIPDDNITDVLMVTDTEGNVYYEVDHLSQNMIYVPAKNTNYSTDNVPFLMKRKIVPRRFTVERDGARVYLQFGHGSDSILSSPEIADPADVVLERHGRSYISSTSFDPNKMNYTDKLGIAPGNTDLRIIYRVNSSANANASSRTITKIIQPIYRFPTDISLDSAKVSRVINSMEVENEEPVVGDVSLPTVDELRIRARDNFATQNRAVTSADYVSLVYSMPPEYGAVKRAAIYQDNSAFRRNLNLYIVSENVDGTLYETPATIKNNISTWLSSKKIINDTIDVVDARIVNFGVRFEVVSNPGTSSEVVLQRCVSTLINELSNPLDIGEPLYISSLFNVLNKLDEVADVSNIEIEQKVGTPYSSTSFRLSEHISNDGRYVNVPKNVILELKYPDRDIRGIVR